jgi:hypothetical protein
MGNLTSSLPVPLIQSITVSSCVFRGNELYGYSSMTSTVGASLFITAIPWSYALINVNIMDSKWANNIVTAESSASAMGISSCVRLSFVNVNSNVSVISSSFLYNKVMVDSSGDSQTVVGGAYSESTLGGNITTTTMIHVAFIANECRTPGVGSFTYVGSGGGVFITRGRHHHTSTLFNDVEWNSNAAANGGAMVYQHRGDGRFNMNVQSCLVKSNIALQQGAGVLLLSTGTSSLPPQSSIFITDSEFWDNYAISACGALCISGMDSVHLTDTSMFSNQAPNAPALWLSDIGRIIIDRVALWENHGQAQVMFLKQSLDITISRSIFKADSSGTAIDIEGQREPIHGGNTTWSCPVGSPLTWIDHDQSHHGMDSPCFVCTDFMG